MNNKYSEWLKIDLHIHSNWSKKTKKDDYEGDFSVHILKQKLKDNGVGIFSITDHNIINVEAYREYYANYHEIDDPLLLLGVELDIRILRNNKERTYHSLLIFDCDNINDVEDINEKLEGIYSNNGVSNLEERNVTIEDIAKELKCFEFFFIPHAYSNKNIVTAYKDGYIKEAQKMVLLMSCALEKVTQEETIEAYNSGFNTLLTDKFKEKNDIPYINFSDNHCVNKYPCHHKGKDVGSDHEFYYIKGAKNFESIRLAFIDPVSRIKTKKQYDEINHSNNTIDKLKIEGNKFIESAELFFSPHLNVIIGGRSSGKSLLMWILGKKINSDVSEDVYSKYYDSDGILIQSRNDSSYVPVTVQNDLIYIKQGDIINYFEHGKLEELAKKSNKLNEYNECKVCLLSHKSNLNDKLSQFKSAYKSLYDFDPKKRFVLHDKSINNVLNKSFIIEFDKSKVENECDYDGSIRSANLLLMNLSNYVNEFYESKFLRLERHELDIIARFNQLIRDKNKLIKKITDANAKTKRFIVAVDDIIEGSNSLLNIEAREKELSKKELMNVLNDVNDLLKKSKCLLEKSKELENFELSFKKDFKIEDDIDFVLEVASKDSIKELIFDGINRCKLDDSLFRNVLFLLQGKNNITIKNYGGNMPDMLSRKIENQLKDFKELFDNPADYLLYREHGSDPESSMNKSPGFNSEKYLSIILNNSHVRTVFIDQPEDNLGNKFISDVLVKLIRTIKFNKQIFLVTHNPSIVVYGDAESVILAKNRNNKIFYRQIVMENIDAKKEICDSLDGGEYIFNNRYNKYNIRRLIKGL